MSRTERTRRGRVYDGNHGSPFHRYPGGSSGIAWIRRYCGDLPRELRPGERAADYIEPEGVLPPLPRKTMLPFRHRFDVLNESYDTHTPEERIEFLRLAFDALEECDWSVEQEEREESGYRWWDNYGFDDWERDRARDWEWMANEDWNDWDVWDPFVGEDEFFRGPTTLPENPELHADADRIAERHVAGKRHHYRYRNR